MRIDAITTCVGTVYQGYLLRSLPIWLDTLDTITIATDKPLHVGSYSNLRVVATTAFTDDGAYLNKGKALNVAYTAANPSDWALSIDADILPEPGWRNLAEVQIEIGCIHGAHRFNDKGEREDPTPLRPKGYFQLWHSHDPNCNSKTPFEDHHPHAAHYDTAFYMQWPIEQRINLGIQLQHLGPKSKNWFGVGAPAHLMRELLPKCKG